MPAIIGHSSNAHQAKVREINACSNCASQSRIIQIEHLHINFQVCAEENIYFMTAQLTHCSMLR